MSYEIGVDVSMLIVYTCNIVYYGRKNVIN